MSRIDQDSHIKIYENILFEKIGFDNYPLH